MSGNVILERIHGSQDARARINIVAQSLIEHGYATDHDHAIELLARALTEPLNQEQP